MKSFSCSLVFLFLIFIPHSLSFNFFNLFSSEDSKPASTNVNFFDLFESKRAQLSVPQCLRNLADIIDELSYLSSPSHFEVTIEKAVKSSTRYSEMFLSCGFGFQLQKFLQIYTFAKENGSNFEETFIKQMIPCSYKIKEYYYEYKAKSDSQNGNVNAFQEFIEHLSTAQECKFIDSSTLLNSTLPCLASIEVLVVEAINIIGNVSSILTVGPAIMKTLYNIGSVCGNTFTSLLKRIDL